MKLISLVALISFICTIGAAEPAPFAHHGAALLKTDIMGVFAHPDDETGVAATLARYAHGDDKTIANIYCTRGEGGGNMVGTHWGRSLGILREAELRECLAQLGVRYCYFLDCVDWAYTESVAATLQKWGKEEALERLVRHVRALRPDVIITMNPAPSPGQHGHHQAAAILATEAFDAAADPARFPEQISREGLAPWQVRKLYYSGSLADHVATIDVSKPVLEGKLPGEIAGAALSNHRSQGFGNFGNSPWMRRPQIFTLVKSVLPATNETNLLAGLPTPDAPRPVKLTASGTHTAQDQPVTLRFVPRPAISAYQEWVDGQGITHVAAQFHADVPVVAGEVTTVHLQIVNSGREAVEGKLDIELPAGWRTEPLPESMTAAPGTNRLTLRIAAPRSATTSEIRATFHAIQKPITTSARLHPVPQATAPMQQAAPDSIAANEWLSADPLIIGTNQIAQGKVDDAADSSGRVRVAHDGKTLFIEVDVADQTVVSNIAPNDIRGHWRSDSVEICIDPTAGAEHTMSAFKLGIFPFDTTGRVRAARDADANQGPVEETAPATRLWSARTEDGYRIRAAIPFAEAGIDMKKSRRIGFNVIIYDGDQADAPLGANINQSRLAWSPRPGIQGRPEDWGRLDLQ